MEWLKFGIPLFVAVCGGMYMYFVHDSKLKKQEASLNAFKLNVGFPRFWTIQK